MQAHDLVGQIDAALKAHGEWRLKLTSAIRTGTCAVSPDDLSCDDKCAFGKWLYGPDFDAATKAGKPYQVTRRLHAEFHDVAGRVARLADSNRPGEAYQLLDTEYTARSETLERALNKWRGELK